MTTVALIGSQDNYHVAYTVHIRCTSMTLRREGRNVTQRIGMTGSRMTYSDGDFSNRDLVRQLLDGVEIVYVKVASPELLHPTITVMRETGSRRLIVAGVLGVYLEVVGD